MKEKRRAASAARIGRCERILLAAALASGVFWVSLAGTSKSVFTEDERDYVQAAIHLARHGVFSHAPVPDAPPPDAYREPGTAAFVALAWRATGVELPHRPEDLLRGDSRARAALRVAHGGFRLAILVAAFGAALAARRMAVGSVAPLAAFALTLASPALGKASEQFASEPLAVAGATFLALALAGVAERPSGVRAASVGLLSGALALVRGSFFLISLALAFVVPLFVVESAKVLKVRVAGAFLAAALVPGGFWMLRNSECLGHFTLSDRSGHVLYARVEVATDLAREGLRPALLAWTPSTFAATVLMESYPESRFASWRWGEGGTQGNFYVRALARRKELIAALGDPLGANRALGREALARIGSAPVQYLTATLPIAWRSLFVERSPEWTRPFDVALPLGLLLASGILVAFTGALLTRDRPVLALLLPAMGSFVVAVLATEGLPRFQEPSLPILWACVVALGDRLLVRRG